MSALAHCSSRVRKFPEPLAEFTAPCANPAGAACVSSLCFPRDFLLRSVENEADRRAVFGAADHIRQTAHATRLTETHWQTHHFLTQLDHPFHDGRATGDHDSARQQVSESASLNFSVNQVVHLLNPRLDDLTEKLPTAGLRVPSAHTGNSDGLIVANDAGQCNIRIVA